MGVAAFYLNSPDAPKPNRGARLGANALITCQGRLLLEKRRDSDLWGLIGGGVKRGETEEQAMVREIHEELGLWVPISRLRRLEVCGEPGRIAAYRDGSVWRMVIVVYLLELETEPVLRISAESRQLRFFHPEELEGLPIAATHADVVARWFP